MTAQLVAASYERAEPPPRYRHSGGGVDADTLSELFN
jgi:hypothetical protein